MGNCTPYINENNKELPVATKIEAPLATKIEDDKYEEALPDKGTQYMDFDGNKENIVKWLLYYVCSNNKDIVLNIINKLYEKNYNIILSDENTSVLIEVCRKGKNWEHIALKLLEKIELCDIFKYNVNKYGTRTNALYWSCKNAMLSVSKILVSNECIYDYGTFYYALNNNMIELANIMVDNSHIRSFISEIRQEGCLHISCKNNLENLSLKIIEFTRKDSIKFIDGMGNSALEYAIDNNMNKTIVKLMEFYSFEELHKINKFNEYAKTTNIMDQYM